MRTARIIEDRSVLGAELSRLGVAAPAIDEALAREERRFVLLDGLDAQDAAALLAAARSQKLAVHERGPRAVLLGPALLLREVARDLPPELGSVLAAALEPRRTLALRHARGVLDLARPAVMGIVNVTPDSFSDAGEAFDAAAAIDRARRMVADGARIVDVGGESTRPGAPPVPLDEELRRVIPVIEALADLGVPISVDTRKAEVAARALAAGAAIVNDVAGLRDEAMRSAVARAGAGAIVMHMRGTPETMQADPRYDDLLGEVAGWLAERAAAAEAAGVAPDAIALDPGFGFGKTPDHNLELLRRLDELRSLGRPVAIGVSRKSTLGKVTGRPPGERLAAGIAAAAIAVRSGANIVRTHDVRETCDAVAMAAAIEGGAPATQVDKAPAPG
jgi:dihydropteroate synthase